MKCEIIRDLLPLYIDGLTCQVSSQEIEKHLKECRDCRNYYQEMTGEIPDVIPKAEADEINIIKKEQKKRKTWKRAVIIVVAVLITIIAIGAWFLYPRKVRYEDVALQYGVEGNSAYWEMNTDPSRILVFSGSMMELDEDVEGGGEKLYLKVKALPIKGHEHYRGEYNLEEGDAIWTFVFSDKTVTIKNGELISGEGE